MSTTPDPSRPGPTVLEGIGLVLAEVLATAPDGGSTRAPLRRQDRWVQDLRVDSLSMVEVLEGTSARFGVVVRDEDTRGLVTVGDLEDLVERQRPGARPRA